ncbi:MAG: aminodeoxychorismate/anthranilate synthase component II [Methanolinea sp.]|nr:aminodeoxychorismate/anthranilate synthase component II [Methanolinea sp.]
MRVVIVDCFDSFTYNLHQMVGALGATPVTLTSDCSLAEIARAAPDRIILSPGPGRPEDAGVVLEVIGEFAGEVPILGVCLGHQAIVHAFGGTIERLETPVHGKTSRIRHSGRGILAGIESPLVATRYHSLAAPASGLPPALEVTAVSEDDGCVMGVMHRDMPIFGLQFHPESIMTRDGHKIVANFLGGGGAR